MTLVPLYSNAVSGTNRFPRPALEARLKRTLDAGGGLKMFGLRRIGKSTLRLCATEHLDAGRRPYAFIDGQGVRSLLDLLGRLAAAMPGERSLFGRARSVITAAPLQSAIEAASAGSAHEDKVVSVYWRIASDAIKSALNDGGPKPALVIDEFSYILQNLIDADAEQGRSDADKLLASLREWRGAGMTMLLTGSLGVTAMARRHRLNAEHLNDLPHFDVPELTRDEARAFVISATKEPSNGAWTEAHVNEFLRQCGVYYPCFLVRGLLEIGLESPGDPSNFAAAFSERVRPDLHADFYRQFDTRYKTYRELARDEERLLVRPALKAILEANQPVPHDALVVEGGFDRVDLALALTMLTEDGFVGFTEDVEGERLWKPASRLARLWWKRSKLA